ncbi:hypothetical protein [Pseudobacteriovorax antillogorgiicola]|uniref:Uncharacterized protein n=1 Tax=Pseudobacteriovorax antillogorgiicola TaxID=1513793 RepID=A0A1Y6B8T1_9BACT|nr:hypothetical protein [Pseudobacteriovorax antillogorgiicola]TCS58809.1 hypothetical protein EDD56_102324 [Pseudobacteriovorax antillogorgiicola]SME94475.1 hypothetical protein SAMN06296036_102119 [Pseudobacteriovorax antillogorgiicola]
MADGNRKFDVHQLQYYFDAKQKDSKDSRSLCSKSRRFLDLRDRMLNLSDQDFNLAIDTLNSLLDNKAKSEAQESASGQEKTHDALALYERSQSSDSSAPSKVSPV